MVLMSEERGTSMNKPCAWLSLTAACNNRCRWCYEHKVVPSILHMPLERAISIIENLAKLGFGSITLLGGEPLLYPFLPEVARRAKELGLEVCMITNGRAGAQRKFLEVIQDVEMIAFTVFSVNPDVHNSIAKASAWDETIAGMTMAIQAGKACCVNLVVGEQNYADASETLRFFDSLGIAVIVSPALPRVCGSLDHIDGQEALHPQRFADLIGHLAGEFGTDQNIQYVFEAPLCLLDRSTYDSLVETNKIAGDCKIGPERIVINVTGQVVPCNVLETEIMFEELGSAAEFIDLWQGQVKAKRNQLLTMSPKCTSCALLPNCHGGCPLVWRYWNLENIIIPVTTQ